MIRAVLTVTQVMDLWDVHLHVLEQDPMSGEWAPIAGSSDTVLGDPEHDHDAVLALLHVVRLWSEMTISR